MVSISLLISFKRTLIDIAQAREFDIKNFVSITLTFLLHQQNWIPMLSVEKGSVDAQEDSIMNEIFDVRLNSKLFPLRFTKLLA